MSHLSVQPSFALPCVFNTIVRLMVRISFVWIVSVASLNSKWMFYLFNQFHILWQCLNAFYPSISFHSVFEFGLWNCTKEEKIEFFFITIMQNNLHNYLKKNKNWFWKLFLSNYICCLLKIKLKPHNLVFYWVVRQER